MNIRVGFLGQCMGRWLIYFDFEWRSIVRWGFFFWGERIVLYYERDKNGRSNGNGSWVIWKSKRVHDVREWQEMTGMTTKMGDISPLFLLTSGIGLTLQNLPSNIRTPTSVLVSFKIRFDPLSPVLFLIKQSCFFQLISTQPIPMLVCDL